VSRRRRHFRSRPDTRLPGVSSRYRCTACGNLTRFDVVSHRRTRSFHHYSLGGELRVEDEVVLEETVEEVSCRWCGTGASVERVEVVETVEAPAGAEAT
jgi:transcription elongation factor Elf1